MSENDFLLVDGSCYVYRAYHAIRSLATKAGEPTNAVYGFASVLLKLLREEKPGYAAVAFDLPAETFRERRFPAYKATRPGMPDELVVQLPRIREFVTACSVAILEVEGYEADDCIGTAATVASSRGARVLIMTSDKDCLQLVGPGVRMRVESSGDGYRDEEWVRTRFDGLSPEQLPEVTGLCGDSSDNIPGVPGVGPKTAVALIRQFGSIDRLLENLDTVANRKLAEGLRNCAEQVRLSRELARIRRDVPLPTGFDDWRWAGLQKNRLREVFEKLEFARLLAQIEKL